MVDNAHLAIEITMIFSRKQPNNKPIINPIPSSNSPSRESPIQNITHHQQIHDNLLITWRISTFVLDFYGMNLCRFFSSHGQAMATPLAFRLLQPLCKAAGAGVHLATERDVASLAFGLHMLHMATNIHNLFYTFFSKGNFNLRIRNHLILSPAN